MTAAAASAGNLKGAALMTASMAAFTLNDACVKLVAQSLPLFQVVALRGVVTTALLVALACAFGGLRLPIGRADRRRIGWRTLWEVGAMVPFFIALTNMPLANVVAILAALPLTITLAAAVWLREPVGWWRVGAIAVGFAGVVLIVQPGTEGFTSYSLVALVAVAAVTARDMATRRLSPGVSSLSVAAITAGAVAIFGAAMSLSEPWLSPQPRDLVLVGAAAVFIIGGYLFSIMVMRVGEVGAVAPFRYTSLVWALALGWLVFGDWPNALTLAGSVLVVATGLFTLTRERRQARRDRRAVAAAAPPGGGAALPPSGAS